jgi:hypothetical protein
MNDASGTSVSSNDTRNGEHSGLHPSDFPAPPHLLPRAVRACARATGRSIGCTAHVPDVQRRYCAGGWGAQRYSRRVVHLRTMGFLMCSVDLPFACIGLSTSTLIAIAPQRAHQSLVCRMPFATLSLQRIDSQNRSRHTLNCFLNSTRCLLE